VFDTEETTGGIARKLRFHEQRSQLIKKQRYSLNSNRFAPVS